MGERHRSGSGTLLVVHPDPGVRARLVATLAQAGARPHGLASLDEAAARADRPSAIVTIVPAGARRAATANGGDARSALPETLRSVPRVIVLDRPDAAQLSAAMALRPAAVILADSDPELIRHAATMALVGAGVVLDVTLAPIAAEILAANIAASESEGHGRRRRRLTHRRRSHDP